MLITEVPGLTGQQKAVLVTKFNAEGFGEAPFEDDAPAHTVTLQGLSERRAAVAGVLACDHLLPEYSLLRNAGIALSELQRQRRHNGQVVLWPKRQGDEAVLASMRWAAHHVDKLAPLTLSGIAARDAEAAKLAEFIGDEAEFVLSLVTVHSSIATMEAAGVLDEIDPDHVHNLPAPEARIMRHTPIVSTGRGLHI